MFLLKERVISRFLRRQACLLMSIILFSTLVVYRVAVLHSNLLLVLFLYTCSSCVLNGGRKKKGAVGLSLKSPPIDTILLFFLFDVSILCYATGGQCSALTRSPFPPPRRATQTPHRVMRSSRRRTRVTAMRRPSRLRARPTASNSTHPALYRSPRSRFHHTARHLVRRPRGGLRLPAPVGR